ncbi:MAG TPA: hypothetical protein VG293_00140 [Solirubrobacteraceae bacterium]|nr:hypothetical protein [Solirubrobacteraceae bacterium]
MRAQERTRLAILALPTTTLALAITIVSTYLGEVTHGYTQQTVVIALVIGSEGIMALWIPLLAGAESDRLRTAIGGRLPFVIAGAVPAAAALVLIGFMNSLLSVALAAAVFFAFYFVAYGPYRTLYPDLVGEDEVAGRAQGTQAAARGLGTAMALLGGGVLLSLTRALPFVVAALILFVAVIAFLLLLLRSGLPEQRREAQTVATLARRLLRLLSLRFDCTLGAQLLRETLAVERGCCSFLTIDYEPADLTLWISTDSAHGDVIAALAQALTGSAAAG